VPVSDEARVHAMMAEACLGTTSDAEFTRDLAAFLEARGLDAPDVAAITSAPPRLALYRRLIRNNLTGVTERMLARTRARLNALGGLFDATFADFLADRGPRTHYLRDVPREFLEWVTPRWSASSFAPAWALDLARHELIEYEVGAARAREETPALADVALERALVLTEPLRVMRSAFAVHELSADLDDRIEPRPRATALLVHRDEEHAVRFLELTPLAAAIVERLLDSATLADAVKGACTDVGTVTSDVVIADVAKLLADLGERGILLGARA
jgi:hypothetical protein